MLCFYGYCVNRSDCGLRDVFGRGFVVHVYHDSLTGRFALVEDSVISVEVVVL